MPRRVTGDEFALCKLTIASLAFDDGVTSGCVSFAVAVSLLTGVVSLLTGVVSFVLLSGTVVSF